MKKIIVFLGVIFLLTIIILNIIFTATLDLSEHITIDTNSILYIIGLIITGTLIYFISRTINKNINNQKDLKVKMKISKIFLFISLFIYITFTIVWTILVRPPIVGDQVHVGNLAQTFYSGNLEEYLPSITYAGIPLSEYMQLYHQQIPLAFVYSLFFKLIHFDGIEVLRVLNVISIFFIVLALYKINKQLSKKYETNKVLLFILILTFISLPMLATFIYGDIPSLALCLFSVYFMMRYTQNRKIRYPIWSSILMMIAFMMRTNSLIFIIATVMYLIFDLSNEFTKKTWKRNLISTIIIIVYIVISILPSSLVKNYCLIRYNMDKDKEYPNISYFLMAMEEGPRANGWYKESIGEAALKDPENIEKEYLERIKERLVYFSQNIGYTFNFYIMKIASMWTENTYSAIRSNVTQDNDTLQNITKPLTFYQKALLIITCLCCLIIIIQNRKKLSLDIIFLITIFVGGFAFHILWEAKSRYILPYIVVLIPIASISINEESIKQNLKKFISKIKNVKLLKKAFK